MITMRHLIIAVLLTFGVTATLFMIRPTNSQSGVGVYNPWADYNEDGEINILDLVPGAVSFSSTGDPTKNVKVTNWPQERSSELRLVYNQTVGEFNYSSGFVYLATVDVSGSKAFTVHAKAIAQWSESDALSIYLVWDAYGITAYDQSFNLQKLPSGAPWIGSSKTDSVITRSDSVKIYIRMANAPGNIYIDLLTIAFYLQY